VDARWPNFIYQPWEATPLQPGIRRFFEKESTMKVSELSFADLIALRDHCTEQIWAEVDKENMRSKPSKDYEVKTAEWERIRKIAKKEIHNRTRKVEE
jgi:hypothetical protein